MAALPVKYEFPPIHSFAPFFTLQRNAATFTSQLKLWSRLVLDYCQHHRIFSLQVDSTTGSLFRNDLIKRELSNDARREVFKSLVEEGNAAWDPPMKGKTKTAEAGSRILVFWRKPEEWADLIYTWVNNTGQNRSIMTFFELTEGDLVQGTDFAMLPIPILRLALAYMEKQGKAKVFEGSESGDTMAGVKFA